MQAGWMIVNSFPYAQNESWTVNRKHSHIDTRIAVRFERRKKNYDSRFTLSPLPANTIQSQMNRRRQIQWPLHGLLSLVPLLPRENLHIATNSVIKYLAASNIESTPTEKKYCAVFRNKIHQGRSLICHPMPNYLEKSHSEKNDLGWATVSKTSIHIRLIYF